MVFLVIVFGGGPRLSYRWFALGGRFLGVAFSYFYRYRTRSGIFSLLNALRHFAVVERAHIFHRHRTRSGILPLSNALRFLSLQTLNPKFTERRLPEKLKRLKELKR